MSIPTLDRRNAVPLYHQIQQHLLDQIRSGVIKPREPVPSEQEISTQLRSSRMTARQALKSLCDLGIAYSQRGKGTFVSEPKLEKNFRQVLSFTEEMRAGGVRPGSQTLSFDVADATGDVARALRLAPQQRVCGLRLRWHIADHAVLSTGIPRDDVTEKHSSGSPMSSPASYY